MTANWRRRCTHRRPHGVPTHTAPVERRASLLANLSFGLVQAIERFTFLLVACCR